MDRKMDKSLQTLPKAELHVHIEGTVTTDMCRRKAMENGITLPHDLFSDDGYQWEDFLNLVTYVYDNVANTLCTAQDYEDITYDYLKRCAKEGSIYEELIVSPDHCERQGLPYPEMLRGMARGIDRAREDFDIEARMNAALVRHLSEKELWQVTKNIVNHRHPYVTGIDLAGGEQSGDIMKFKPYFDYIEKHSNGELGVRLHAAEVAGPENGWDALKLNPTRLGHGIRSIEDPKLIAEIKKRNIALEVCPTSNILAVKETPSYKDHPLRKLYDQNVKVTLNSDDPGLFGNSIGYEYQVAKDHFGFDKKELLELTKNAIEAAFVDEKTREKLLKKVEDYGFFLKKPSDQRRTPPGPKGL